MAAKRTTFAAIHVCSRSYPQANARRSSLGESFKPPSTGMTWRESFPAEGVADTRQLLTTMTRRRLRTLVDRGELVRVERGIYAIHRPDTSTRLAALNLRLPERPAVCMQTAAALYGFDTEPDNRLHILDPGVRVRPSADVMVHQRIGAPLRLINGQLATDPAWTAVEIARTLKRPRALGVLDASLHSRACSPPELALAVREQRGRRGIVNVRGLLEHADGGAESPMESEARLVFIDGGLPKPELQFEIVDMQGKLWRVDFAWPEFGVVAEYESMEWHASPEALKHDRMKVARLQEVGYLTIPLVVDDVRRYPTELVARIRNQFERTSLTG